MKATMKLILDDDQKLLGKTAAQFTAQNTPVERFRKLRDADGPLDLGMYRQMAELGWTALTLPEQYGGLDLGFAELALVLEALGSQLAPEPFISTLMASQALLMSDAESLKERWLPEVASGESVLTLAHADAGSRYNPHDISTRADRSGEGWVLKGRKVDVLDAAESSALLIPARISGERRDADGIGLFLVRPEAEGLTLKAQKRVDSRSASIVDLDGVPLEASAIVSEDAGALLSQVIDRATIALCAEMLGGMTQAFQTTVAYLKERKQFGVAIGSFQALKHRAATLFTELSLARTAVMAATRTVDSEAMASRVPLMASLVKARCSDAYMLIASEGVQMFGGVGMTDEYDIGLYLKRARATEFTFGDAPFHRNRWATLSGY